MRVPACPPRYELILTEFRVLDASIICPRSCLLHLKCKTRSLPLKLRGCGEQVPSLFKHVPSSRLKKWSFTSSSKRQLWACPCLDDTLWNTKLHEFLMDQWTKQFLLMPSWWPAHWKNPVLMSSCFSCLVVSDLVGQSFLAIHRHPPGPLEPSGIREHRQHGFGGHRIWRSQRWKAQRKWSGSTRF